jgi:hypothetical protein
LEFLQAVDSFKDALKKFHGDDIENEAITESWIGHIFASGLAGLSNFIKAQPHLYNCIILKNALDKKTFANKDIGNKDVANKDVANKDVTNKDVANKDVFARAEIELQKVRAEIEKDE